MLSACRCQRAGLALGRPCRQPNDDLPRRDKGEDQRWYRNQASHGYDLASVDADVRDLERSHCSTSISGSLDIFISRLMQGPVYEQSSLGISQLLDDGLGQILVNLVMPWQRLGLFGCRIGVPVVTPTVTNKDAPHLLQ
jgi:hypothetical protein